MKTSNTINKKLIEDLFIDIPFGNIDMRDDRIKKVWTVELKKFKISKYPVTQELYEAITGKNPSTFVGKKNPVETVSWVDAILFCNQLSELFDKKTCYIIDFETKQITYNADIKGFRLPFEAEWQYACQSETKEIRYGNINEIAWYKDNSKNQTQQVGQKLPNNWGLFDMLGNVWEWCNDIYDETVYGTYRIFRGGGWCDAERSVMSTTRRRSHPFSFKIDDLGFRIAINSND